MNPEPHNVPTDLDIECKTKSLLQIIEKLERHIDESEFVPATNQHRGQVVLALLSKSLTVGRAVCCLVQSGFGEEAFGLTRTLMDIRFNVRYISNRDTEARAQRYVEFFAKDSQGWRTIIPKYFPNMLVSNSEEHQQVIEIAKNYKSPHDWSGEPHKTKSLAEEPDTYEFDSRGNGITALADYEIFYKMASHFVHATVCGIESHVAPRFDTFRVRINCDTDSHANLALNCVAAQTATTFVCGFRALRYEQPDEILRELFDLIKPSA